VPYSDVLVIGLPRAIGVFDDSADIVLAAQPIMEDRWQVRVWLRFNWE
jgi:hypothetical protein